MVGPYKLFNFLFKHCICTLQLVLLLLQDSCIGKKGLFQRNGLPIDDQMFFWVGINLWDYVMLLLIVFKCSIGIIEVGLNDFLV